MGECGLDSATRAIQISRYTHTGVLDGHIGQQVDLGVAISCRLVQDHGHSSQEQDLTRVVGGSERILEDAASFRGPRSFLFLTRVYVSVAVCWWTRKKPSRWAISNKKRVVQKLRLSI